MLIDWKLKWCCSCVWPVQVNEWLAPVLITISFSFVSFIEFKWYWCLEIIVTKSMLKFNIFYSISNLFFIEFKWYWCLEIIVTKSMLKFNIFYSISNLFRPKQIELYFVRFSLIFISLVQLLSSFQRRLKC
jgi:hypothetical protein